MWQVQQRVCMGGKGSPQYPEEEPRTVAGPTVREYQGLNRPSLLVAAAGAQGGPDTRKRQRCSEGLCQPAQHHILPEARKSPSRPLGNLLFLWGRKRK